MDHSNLLICIIKTEKFTSVAFLWSIPRETICDDISIKFLNYQLRNLRRHFFFNLNPIKIILDSLDIHNFRL